jgi:hypothetical protein
MSHLFRLCVLASLALATPAADPAPGPAADVPELNALSNWVGRWEGELTVKPTGENRGGTSKGLSTGQWVLDGRFLRQDWTVVGSPTVPKITGSALMTYDPQRKTYRSWTFMSTGQVNEDTGSWDAKTRTMTWTNRSGDVTTVTTAAFSADGRTETWSILSKDRAGKIVGDIRGTNTRRTE